MVHRFYTTSFHQIYGWKTKMRDFLGRFMPKFKSGDFRTQQTRILTTAKSEITIWVGDLEFGLNYSDIDSIEYDDCLKIITFNGVLKIPY